MKKKIIKEKNEKGLYSKTTITEKKPEDGFVSENKERMTTSWSETIGSGNYKFHKGYAKKISSTTNDPIITRPVAYTICGIFFAIGIIALLLHSWLFGIAFIVMTLYAFYKSKKDIDAIAKELKSQGHDVTIDSEEEAEE